jgi:hypothetical protein
MDLAGTELSDSMKLAISNEKSFGKPSVGYGIGLAQSTNSSIAFCRSRFSVNSTLHPAFVLEASAQGVFL